MRAGHGRGLFPTVRLLLSAFGSSYVPIFETQFDKIVLVTCMSTDKVCHTSACHFAQARGRTGSPAPACPMQRHGCIGEVGDSQASLAPGFTVHDDTKEAPMLRAAGYGESRQSGTCVMSGLVGWGEAEWGRRTRLPLLLTGLVRQPKASGLLLSYRKPQAAHCLTYLTVPVTGVTDACRVSAGRSPLCSITRTCVPQVDLRCCAATKACQ